jgi:penicillin-binding protein 1A
VRTTLDIDLQAAAENAVKTHLSNPDGPAASMVVIDNDSAAVRAMVGGLDYAERPFNLATQGQRQPGSAFKPFVLAAAIRAGISPGRTYESRKKIFDVPGTGGKEKFVVNNYEGQYSGVTSLAAATTVSDNSVYAEVGFETGFKPIAKMARDMGIRTPVSTNPAITLGGLKQGVTVLDMAHAYETFATRGKRIEGSLGARNGGPVGIRLIEESDGDIFEENETRAREVFSPALADAVTPILQSVVSSGTGTDAQWGGFAAGKTGTTENYGDAWFVGYTDRFTIAVWVGYPDSVKPMETEFGGAPVAGGTFPAQIWRAFVTAAEPIMLERAAKEAEKRGETVPTTTAPVPAAPSTTAPADPDTSVSSGDDDTGGEAPSGGATETPTPAPAPEPEPAPAPAAPPPSSAPAPGSTGGVSPGTGGTAPPASP